MPERADLFPWPTPDGASLAPRWTGQGFHVGGSPEPILSFLVEQSGWTDELSAMHEAEAGADHPMDIASRNRAIGELQHHLGQAPTILEVGCSSGWLLRDARRAMPNALVIGADYVRGPLVKLAAALPDLPLMQFDLTRCPLPDACVDGVVALNVLEHIEDDHAAVREICRILKPGGVAVIELPAGPHLFDVHDRVLMHHRRYRLADAVSLFERAGFRVKRQSHLGFFLYPAFAFIKRKNQRHLSKTDDEQRAIVAESIRTTRSSPAMRMLLRVEELVGRHAPYPFGVRCVFTAVKK